MDRTDRIEKMISALLPWYRSSGRSLPWREAPTPYHVWVSEIMLQQTRIETVIPYYTRFLEQIPDVASLAAADPEHLQKLWEGLGYYSRVRNLQAAARQIMTRFNGQFPDNYEDIRSLCGIGDYTAGAISSICFDLPIPAVDGNVLRVLSRITADSRPISEEKTRKEIRKELAAVYPPKDAGTCTQAIMELGETVCLPNGTPFCAQCPCREFCCSSKGDWAVYPVKAEKKARRKEAFTLLILQCGEYTAIRKRADKGLLSGLWELPNLPGHLSGTEAFQQAETWGCSPFVWESKGFFSHIFTHIEWDMQCFCISCNEMPPCFSWVNEYDLKNSVSLPTAFRKVLR